MSGGASQEENEGTIPVRAGSAFDEGAWRAGWQRMCRASPGR